MITEHQYRRLMKCPRKFLRLLLKLACGLGVIMEPSGGPGKPMAFPDLWTVYPLSIMSGSQKLGQEEC